MLLILTNSHDATADYLVSVLDRHGIKYLRFDTDSSLGKTNFSFTNDGPRLCVAGVSCTPDDFANVWYRRPERLKANEDDGVPEGKFILDEWSEALEGFFAHIQQSKWMNHPSCNVLASHKLHQLTIAKVVGLSVPDTLVTQDAVRLRDFFRLHGGAIVAKPMARGYVERPADQNDSLIYTNRIRKSDLDCLDDLRTCPTLFQQYIDKRADVRITAVDSHFCAAELLVTDSDGRQRCDVRRHNMEDVSYHPIPLPHDVECKLRRLMQYFCLRFGAIDMVIDTTGRWLFLEINPNGQWAWLDLVGGMNIAEHFVSSFGSS